MSWIRILGSRLGIDQLWLDTFPEIRLDRPQRDQIHAASQHSLELVTELDEAQADGGIDVDQDVDITVLPSVSSCPRTEEGHPPDRETPAQARVLLTKGHQDVFRGQHCASPLAGPAFMVAQRRARRRDGLSQGFKIFTASREADRRSPARRAHPKPGSAHTSW